MRRVLVVGAGKRVRETALPALHRAADAFRVVDVRARSARPLEVDGRTYEVRPLDELRPDDLAEVDLVYLAVGKDATPSVLGRLAAHDVARLELLVDTPVVRFKHFRHAARLGAFRAAWVAEDVVRLPWVDLVRDAVAAGVIGAPREVALLQSGYAYHGVAIAKALFGAPRVLRGRRRRVGGGFAVRTLALAGGTRALVVEPRDYAAGRVLVTGSEGVIADERRRDATLRLEPLVEDGGCVGFRLGEREARLAPEEAELARGAPVAPTVSGWMDPLKRVGFLRLLRAIEAGGGAYPLADGLEDMVVDYHLERLGRYVATPLTDPRSPLARGLLRLVTRASS